MLPPTAVVAAQMDALQMNDWPDPDSGVRTAFLFSKPFECESMVAGRVSFPLGSLTAGEARHYHEILLLSLWISTKSVGRLLG